MAQVQPFIMMFALFGVFWFMMIRPQMKRQKEHQTMLGCLLYTSPSPRDATLSRMPSSA